MGDLIVVLALLPLFSLFLDESDNLNLVDEEFEIYELDRGWFNQNIRFRPVGSCLKGAKTWRAGIESVGMKDYCIYWGRKLGMIGKGFFGPGMVLRSIEDLWYDGTVEDLVKFNAFSKADVIREAKQRLEILSEEKGENVALLRLYFLFTGVVPFDPGRQSEDDLVELSDRIVEGIKKGNGWSPLFSQFGKVSP